MEPKGEFQSGNSIGEEAIGWYGCKLIASFASRVFIEKAKLEVGNTKKDEKLIQVRTDFSFSVEFKISTIKLIASIEMDVNSQFAAETLHLVDSL